MSTFIHFVNVGQGNMVLIQTENGKNLVFDCNITEDNQINVLKYVKSVFGNQPIHAFICSHRDADHMRGIRKLHTQNSIRIIWDSGYPGTTTTSSEYHDYMRLRNEVGNLEIKKFTYKDFGTTRFRYMSSKDDRLQSNANAQGIVIKIEQRTADLSKVLSSVMLTADSDAQTWRNAVMKDYNRSDMNCCILMAGHHGSITFFDDPSDSTNYYVDHIKAFSPAITVVSVGDNGHGHPADEAIELYEKYSSGSSQGNKIFRTDIHGNIKLELKSNGGWSILKNL